LKKILVPFLAIACFLLTSGLSSGESSDQLPPPLWSYTVDEEMNINLAIRKVGDQLYLKNSGIGDATVVILNDKDGKAKTTFRTNDQEYTDWGYMTETGSKGEIYSLYTEKGAYRLRATNSKGEILWSKTFNEKVDEHSGITGIFMLNNDTFLVYIRLSTYKYDVYKFDSSGKQLLKKQFNEFIHDYQNGYLITYSSLGKTKARISFYDANLSLKFKRDITFGKDDFRGISSDGTVYYTGYDKLKKTTTVIARNTKGTLLWSKTIPGELGRDNYYPNNPRKEGLLIEIGNTLYRFNAKGLVSKKAFAEKPDFQIGQDLSVLVKDGTRLTLLNDKLEVLRTANIATSPQSRTYKYFGNGVVYTYDWKSAVLSKIDWMP